MVVVLPLSVVVVVVFVVSVSVLVVVVVVLYESEIFGVPSPHPANSDTTSSKSIVFISSPLDRFSRCDFVVMSLVVYEPSAVSFYQIQRYAHVTAQFPRLAAGNPVVAPSGAHSLMSAVHSCIRTAGKRHPMA